MGKVKILPPSRDNKIHLKMNSAISKKRTNNESQLKKKNIKALEMTVKESIPGPILKKTVSSDSGPKKGKDSKVKSVPKLPRNLFTMRDEVTVGSFCPETVVTKVSGKTKRIVPVDEKKKTKKRPLDSEDQLSVKRVITPKVVGGKKQIVKRKTDERESLEESHRKVVADNESPEKHDEPQTGLNGKALLKPVNAVFRLYENNSKKTLLDSCAPIYIKLDTINPVVPAKKVIRFYVSHSLATDTSDVCLIVKDSFKEPERTIELVKERLKTAGITCITEIIPFKMLDADYNQYEDRRKLCHRFDFFLVDSTIAHRCVKKLGKPFYAKCKFPVPVRLGINKNLKVEIEKGLSKITAVIERATVTICFKVGHTSMMPEQVRNNVISVWSSLDKLIPGGCSNIKMASLKLAESKSILFYSSIKCPNQVNMKQEKLIWKKSAVSKTPIPGEISTQPEASVLVYPSGDVVLKGEMIDDDERKAKETERKENKSSSGKFNVKEESSDEKSDIEDAENQYLIELGKSKGLKELAKEEAKKAKTKKSAKNVKSKESSSSCSVDSLVDESEDELGENENDDEEDTEDDEMDDDAEESDNGEDEEEDDSSLEEDDDESDGGCCSQL